MTAALDPRDALRASSLFAGLPDAELEALHARGALVEVASGEALLSEGEDAGALYVIVAGELEVVRGTGADEVSLAQVGPGSVQGEMALLEGRPRNATARALTPVTAFRLSGAVMLELLATRPQASLAIVRTTLQRLRSTEALLAQREKLASLGTLAAGLAHELNNPAAAIRRSADALGAALAARTDAARALATADAPRLARLVEAQAADPADAPVDAIERADRIDALRELLASLGVAAADDAAASLVAAGWLPETVESALVAYRGGPVDAAARWLASSAGADALLGEIAMAADRMSEIVRAVKGYAYLDQAPVQRIDLRDGIEDTLIILRHRLRDISVARDYAADVPQIEAHGGELNQVWTNIIDNAVDAMEGRGAISIAVRASGPGGATVELCDDGPGIPAELLPRLFEPFVTTKAQGVGTGLGLHIAHQVVARHGGRLTVESRPGRTCFRVTLPGMQGPAAAGSGAR